MKQVIVTEEQLATHWSMTTRRVRQLSGDGVAVRAKGGYDLLESDKRMISWLRNDEETKAAKRKLMEQQLMLNERKFQRSERELLTIDEVRETLNEAWSRMWMTHANVAAHVRNALYALPNDQQNRICFEIEANCKGELRLLSTVFEDITKQSAEKLNCRVRNGLLQCGRNMRMLDAEFGSRPDEAH